MTALVSASTPASWVWKASSPSEPTDLAPGDRGIWVKSKCLNHEEFVVVGWTDPAGSRRHFGALLLGYYTEDGRLHYAGRAGTGFNERELARLAGVLKPLETRTHRARNQDATGRRLTLEAYCDVHVIAIEIIGLHDHFAETGLQSAEMRHYGARTFPVNLPLP